FGHWHKVHGWTDDALFGKIRDDGIDILVDLDGHTAENRLLTFARKPAPIQASWLGYLATTGLSAMDYYLADRYLLPPGKLDSQFTEKPVQLPANAPFKPFAGAPEVNELPALKNGHLTFACFNRTNKITPGAVSLWAKLLKAVPDARMLLGAMPQAGSYDTLIGWFADEGIAQERLIFHPRSSMEAYLALHHQADICLDTFPSSGVTTTCHAVWMGVPTLCLNGNSMTSRGAQAVMSHVGLQDFVAEDHEDFVRRGVGFAHNLIALAEVRRTLRDSFNRSALGQPAVIAAGLESAFRTMWTNWCQGLPPATFEVEQK
ncbi:MAG TPA: glycosyltransferase, partial [Gallionella sp.]|nr:glycosyltransferase [Gallionella sp.]